jgi:hypothetical protein
MAKEEKRKSREVPKAAMIDTTGATTGTAATGDDDEAARTADETPTSPTSPKSESKGIKSLLSKLKRHSKHFSSPPETENKGFIGGIALRNSESQSQTHSRQGSANPTHIPVLRDSEVSSTTSDEDRGRSTERISTVPAPQVGRTTTGFSEASDVSKVSPERPTAAKTRAYSDVSEYEEARDDFNEALAPPPTFTSTDESAARRGSPTRDSKFHEVGI